MRLHSIVIVAALSFTTGACSGALFQSRAESGGGRTAASVRVEQHLALRVDELAPNADGIAKLEGLLGAIRSTSGEQRAALRARRGELIADLLVVARAYRDLYPEMSEWYASAAGLLVGVSPFSETFEPSATERLRIDLAASGEGRRAAAVGAVRWALEAESAPNPELGPRAQVIQALQLVDGLEPWLRFGDDLDGGLFAARAIEIGRPRTAAPFQPEAGLHPDLVDGANERTITALQVVWDAVSDVQSLDAPIARALSARFEAATQAMEAAWLPLRAPSELVSADARIEPPRSFLPPPPEAGSELGFTFRRVVVVRADGAAALVLPHIGIEGGQVVERTRGSEWAYPGADLVEFEGFGAVRSADLQDDTLPAVVAAFEALDAWLESNATLPAEESFSELTTPGVSLIVDGDLYYSSLRPVLGSLYTVGYSPIALHTLHEPTGALDAVAVRLVSAPAEEDNLLIVREDGYLLQVWDPESLTSPVRISRTDDAPALAVHRAVRDGFASGALDPARPLTIVVDDNSVDYGILAHLVAAVSFDRELDGVARDADLMRAPVVWEGSRPTVLCPGGLRLAL